MVGDIERKLTAGVVDRVWKGPLETLWSGLLDGLWDDRVSGGMGDMGVLVRIGVVDLRTRRVREGQLAVAVAEAWTRKDRGIKDGMRLAHRVWEGTLETFGSGLLDLSWNGRLVLGVDGVGLVHVGCLRC
jgi:hypothetical protein